LGGKLASKIPQRKLPTVEISSEELKTVSAITGMLAEKPEVLKKIAKRMEELSSEYEQKVKTEVINTLAENVKIDAAKIGEIQQYWWWYIPHIWWHQYWYTSPWIEGPYLNPYRFATERMQK
jgi:hypothetical protein